MSQGVPVLRRWLGEECLDTPLATRRQESSSCERILLCISEGQNNLQCSCCPETDGEVIGGACTRVAGKGQACSYVAALLFFLEALKQKGTTTVPSQHSKIVTDKLQQWHVPPKCDIAPKSLSDIAFHKAAYGTAKKVKIQPREESTATADCQMHCHNW